MELRRGVCTSSSWEVSGDPQNNILFIRSSSTGIHLDEPLLSERPSNTPLSLLHPTTGDNTNTSCYLYIDWSKLRGYLPSSLELVSESKTVEVYRGLGEEYCSTGRGVLVPTDEDGAKLYSCVLDLPNDVFCNKIALKLLSLQGKRQVAISKLFVNVSEDYGGSRVQTIHTQSEANPIQPHQLLSSLASSPNLPPFLKNLVMSLQTASSNDGNSNNTHGATPFPVDLTKMSEAFRKVHSTIAPPVVESKPEELEQNSDSLESSDECDCGSQVAITDSRMEERMALLERKLESYIDAKFIKLEQKINARFEEIMSGIHSSNVSANQTLAGATNDSDGAEPKMPVLVADDNQLD